MSNEYSQLALPLIAVVGVISFALVILFAVCYRIFAPPPDYSNPFFTKTKAEKLEAALDK